MHGLRGRCPGSLIILQIDCFKQLIREAESEARRLNSQRGRLKDFVNVRVKMFHLNQLLE